jgi:hypothetical protein
MVGSAHPCVSTRLVLVVGSAHPTACAFRARARDGLHMRPIVGWALPTNGKNANLGNGRCPP